MAKVIGKVSATEKCPSTIDEFYFWTDSIISLMLPAILLDIFPATSAARMRRLGI